MKITFSQINSPLSSLCVCVITASVLLSTLYFLHATFAHAEFLSSSASGPQLEITPRYPAPGETVTVRYADYSYSSGGALQWFINGAREGGSDNQTTITVTAPALGTPLSLEARLAVGDGTVRSASATVVPSAVDIIFEGDTKVPSFYEGRRVPSVGSHARIIGIPHIFTASGARIPASSLSYSWTINNELIRAGRGDMVLDTQLSNIGDSMVALAVDSADGSVHYEKSFFIETVEPHLSFYVLNPLTGLSRNAIADKYLRAKDEVTVRAEPYFVGGDIYGNAQYGWTVNQQATENANTDPQLITLRKAGGGIADIGFSLRNLGALSQFAADLFQLEFE